MRKRNLHVEDLNNENELSSPIDPGYTYEKLPIGQSCSFQFILAMFNWGLNILQIIPSTRVPN